MNLNYGYDKQALIALAQTADTTLDEHQLVIDFDGEVIIDPEIYFPHVPVSSYKFSTSVKNTTLKSWMMIAALYDALEKKFNELNNAPTLAIGQQIIKAA